MTRLLITGPPCVGKSTMSSLLAAHYQNVLHLSFKQNTTSKPNLSQRSSSSKEFLNELQSTVSSLPEDQGFIISGFPRSFIQFMQMESMQLRYDLLILLTEPEKLSLYKSKLRKYCENCDKSFCNFEFRSGDYQIPNISLGVESNCPICENKLQTRADDNLRVFKKRYFEFKVFSDDLKKHFTENPAFLEFHMHKGVDDLSRLITEISKRSFKQPKLLE